MGVWICLRASERTFSARPVRRRLRRPRCRGGAAGNRGVVQGKRTIDRFTYRDNELNAEDAPAAPDVPAAWDSAEPFTGSAFQPGPPQWPEALEQAPPRPSQPPTPEPAPEPESAPEPAPELAPAFRGEGFPPEPAPEPAPAAAEGA